MSVNKLKEAIVLHNKRFLLLRGAFATVSIVDGPRSTPCNIPLGSELLAYDRTSCNVGSTFSISKESGLNLNHTPHNTEYSFQHSPCIVSTYSQRMCRHGDPPLVAEMMAQNRLRERSVCNQTLKTVSQQQITSSRLSSHCTNSYNVIEMKHHTYFHGENGKDISKADLVAMPTPAQLSFVFLKLREELPAFFSGHHSYDMYSVDMKYENKLSAYPWRGHGVRGYRLFLTSSRLALQSMYSHLAVDLIKITKDVAVGKVEARWRVRGSLRYSLFKKERVVLDGFSTFTVNPCGLISLHKIGCIMPPPKEPLMSRTFHWLAKLSLSQKVIPQPEELQQPLTHSLTAEINC